MFQSDLVSSIAKWYGVSSSAASWTVADAHEASSHPAIASASEESLALATSLQLRTAESRVIVFAAAEVPHSTVSLVASLGHALVQLGAGEVLMLDFSQRTGGSGPVCQSASEQLFSGDALLPGIFDQVLPGLYVLTPDSRSSEKNRMSSEGTKALFDSLRQAFRYVLVAAPPYARDSEARLLAKHGDGIVLTLQQGQQGRTRLLQIQRELKAQRLVSLGFILSRVSAT